MKLHTTIVVSWAVLASILVSTTEAHTGLIESTPPPSDRVYNLETIISGEEFDPDVENQEVRDLICTGLKQDEQDARVGLLTYLQNSTRWINLTLYEDCFLVNDHEDASIVRQILDDSQFEFTPSDTRRRVLEDCLKNDGVDLWRGSQRSRLLCIGLAALEGDKRLMTVAMEEYQSLSGREKAILPRSALMANFELSKGSLGGQDAQSTGVQRVSAIPADQLFERLQTDPGFARAFQGLVARSCGKPWAGDCQTMNDVFTSLANFYSSSLSSPEQMSPEHLPDWWRASAQPLQKFETWQRMNRSAEFDSSQR